MKKYYKIGEISKLYNIGIDSLRYYEEIGLINPERSESGYRLYSTNDIYRLNVIRDLRELGFDMKHIQYYLENRSIETTEKLLEKEIDAINEKMKSLADLKQNVEERLKNIQKSTKILLGKTILKKYKDRKCFKISEGYSNDFEMDILIKKLVNIDKNYFYIIGNNQIGTFIDMTDFNNKNSLKYKSVFIIDEDGKATIEGGTYLSISYRGNYNQSRDYLKILIDYANNNNYKILDDVLEILWVDIHTTSNVEEYVTELQVRVETK